ncbi:NUDIX domain-containing protein [Hyphomonas sediminis]
MRSLPSGRLGTGERPEDAVHRELENKTGRRGCQDQV